MPQNRKELAKSQGFPLARIVAESPESAIFPHKNGLEHSSRGPSSVGVAQIRSFFLVRSGQCFDFEVAPVYTYGFRRSLRRPDNPSKLPNPNYCPLRNRRPMVVQIMCRSIDER